MQSRVPNPRATGATVVSSQSAAPKISFVLNSNLREVLHTKGSELAIAYNQLDSGSCTACAALYLYLHLPGNAKSIRGEDLELRDYCPSFTQLTTETRLTRTPGSQTVELQDAGGVPLSSALEAIVEHGTITRPALAEALGLSSLDEELALDARKLSSALTKAKLRLSDLPSEKYPKMVNAYRLWPSVRNLVSCLHAEYAFAFAMLISEAGVAWLEDRVAQMGSGFVFPYPGGSGKRISSHAVTCTGYTRRNDGSIIFTILNSFGESWGDNGRFYVSSDAMEDFRFASNEFFIVAVGKINDAC